MTKRRTIDPRRDWKVTTLLERGYQSGVSMDDLKSMAITANSWSYFKTLLEEAIESHGK